MWLEKRKAKGVERKFTSAVLTFLFYPSPNRIWIISCFISKRWFREYLPILIQANAECEMAASNRNDPPDKKVCSGISWLVPYSLSCLCRLQLSKMQKNDGQRKKKDGLLIRCPPACLDTHIFIEAAITMTTWGIWTHMLLPCQMQYESLWMETRMCRCVSKCVSLSLLYTEYQNTHSTSKVRTLEWQWGQCGWSPQLQRLWPGFKFSLGFGIKLGAV